MFKRTTLIKNIIRTKKYTYTDSKMRFNSVRPIYPPPGDNLVIPDWTVEKFFDKIGFGSKEYMSNFEKLEDVFKMSSVL